MRPLRMFIVQALLCSTILCLTTTHAFAQPVTCVASSFSSSGTSGWKTIILTLINGCGRTVDFQNSTIRFKTADALNTSFWGNFSPLSYPDNSLLITSQGTSGSYLASLSLHFPEQMWANSKLLANQRFQIIYGAVEDRHIGSADVYLSDSSVIRTGNIQLSNTSAKPSDVSQSYAVVRISANGNAVASVQLPWGGTQTVLGLQEGSYIIAADNVSGTNNTYQGSASPSTVVVVANQTVNSSVSYSPVQQAGTPVSQNGQLSVCGNGLCNERGSRIQLKGMSSHGIQWYGWQNSLTSKPCLTTASLDMLANTWKASVIRISMYVQEGGYETNPTAFTNQVNALIDEATRRGIYAIVDWHILTPGDPNVNLSKAKTFFTAIASAHKNNNNLFYEIANEPNGVSWDTIKTYAEALIPVIRAVDNKSIILVGTPGWSSLGVSDGRSSQDIINAPLSFPNIMYTFHFYAASHRDEYLNEVDFASNTLPIFVTEFGEQTYSGDGTNDFAMTDRYLQLFANKKISWTNWNYSDDPLSGAIWKNGACSNGPWTDSNLKASGIYIKAKIMN